MMTQIRSSDQASRLYRELTDQISDANEEEIRRTYKQLLRNGESLGAIVGAAISSIREMQDSGGRGRSAGDGSTSNEVSEAKRAPVELRQNASEVAMQHAPVVHAHTNRPHVAESQSADAMSARQRAQTEPTRVTSEVEMRGPATANRVGDPEIRYEPRLDITDDPRPISSPEVRQYLSLSSRLQQMMSPISAATRSIIVLTAVLVAAASIGLLLHTHRPADENLAVPLHPAAVSPPSVSGLSGTATATLSGERAALGLDKGRAVTVSTVASTAAAAAAIVTSSIVVPTEMRTSPPEVAPLLERGDALLATGDLTSARLFYEAAADAGDASAAFRLGATFDPIFIERANLRGVRADIERAVSWYRRAQELGSSDAENLLKDLKQAKP